jgi:hypothetical protein
LGTPGWNLCVLPLEKTTMIDVYIYNRITNRGTCHEWRCRSLLGEGLHLVTTKRERERYNNGQFVPSCFLFGVTLVESNRGGMVQKREATPLSLLQLPWSLNVRRHDWCQAALFQVKAGRRWGDLGRKDGWSVPSITGFEGCI